MSKITTVADFLEIKNLTEPLSGSILEYAMIEFAKLHVEKSLKAASNVLNVNNDGDYVEHPTQDRILNSYSLKNIL